MEKSLYTEILELLYDKGLNQSVNITSLVDKTFPLDKNYELLSRDNQINYYLKKMDNDGYLTFSLTHLKDSEDNLMDGLVIKATITIYGYNFITNLKRDQSTIETNKAIATNSKNQTLILIGALAVSVVSLLISIFSFFLKQQPQVLLLPKEPIRILTIDKPSPKIETSPSKEVKKNSPKKP